MNVQTFRNSFLKNRPSGFGNKDCVPSFEFSVLIMIFEMVCRRIIETKDVFLKYCKADNPPITLETIEKIIKLADHFTGFSQFGYKTMQSQAQLVHQFFTYDIFIGCLEWFGTGKNNNGKIKWLQGDEQDDDLHDDDISEKIEGLQLEQSASRDSTKDESHFSVNSSSSSSNSVISSTRMTVSLLSFSSISVLCRLIQRDEPLSMMTSVFNIVSASPFCRRIISFCSDCSRQKCSRFYSNGNGRRRRTRDEGNV